MHQYNTTLPDIPLKSYGRHVAKMLEEVLKNPDRDSRSQQAKVLISVMKRIAKKAKVRHEEESQLWADLFAMADYRLDIDAPYPLHKKTKPRITLPQMTYQIPMKYPRCCGRYFFELMQEVASYLETSDDLQANEAMSLELLKCAQMLHKKETPMALLHHMETVMKQKLPLTPEVVKTLPTKSAERKKNYSHFRNERKY